MSDLVFLYAAYTIVWAGVLAYVFWLHLEQRRLAREMEVLKEVADGEGSVNG